MQSIETLLIFATASIALSATPGPDMLLIVSRTVAQGRTAGFLTLAGAQVGTVVHALAAALGLSQLMLHVPAAYEVIRWIGAAYLLWLAWKTIRSAHIHSVELDDPPRISRGRIFIEGLLTNLLNPKMVVFIIALFPQFYEADSGSMVLQFFILAMIINATGLIANGTVILCAGKIGASFRRNGRVSAVAQYLLGAVFAGLAARMVLARDA